MFSNIDYDSPWFKATAVALILVILYYIYTVMTSDKGIKIKPGKYKAVGGGEGGNDIMFEITIKENKVSMSSKEMGEIGPFIESDGKYILVLQDNPQASIHMDLIYIDDNTLESNSFMKITSTGAIMDKRKMNLLKI
jgi:hypothetical protein